MVVCRDCSTFPSRVLVIFRCIDFNVANGSMLLTADEGAFSGVIEAMVAVSIEKGKKKRGCVEEMLCAPAFSLVCVLWVEERNKWEGKESLSA